MKEEQRFKAYCAMHTFVRTQYEMTAGKLDRLKAEGKEKTAVYRQLLGDKLFYKSVLALYKTHGLE